MEDYIRKNALIDFLVDMSTLEMYADVEEGIRLCISWIKSIQPVHVRYVPDTDVGESIKNPNRLTNADRIRSLSDEELARVLLSAETNGRAYGPSGLKALLDWLKSPPWR